MALKTTQIRVATLLLAVWPALAQVTATVKPVSMPGAQGTLGNNRLLTRQSSNSFWIRQGIALAPLLFVRAGVQ